MQSFRDMSIIYISYIFHEYPWYVELLNMMLYDKIQVVTMKMYCNDYGIYKKLMNKCTGIISYFHGIDEKKYLHCCHVM